MDLLSSAGVSVAHRPGGRYPELPPFDPGEAYPEYPFAASGLSPAPNDAYFLVRTSLQELGLDRARHGTRDWNPLEGWVRPGDTVMLKPNWVYHRHPDRSDLDAVVTHSAVLRAVADYVLIALRGSGRLVLGDAPLPSADFDLLRRRLSLDAVAEALQSRSGIPVSVRDLRKLRHHYSPDEILTRDSRVDLSGDPEGYVTVNLGADSEFAGLPDLSRIYGADYDRTETLRHHQGDRHEYLISGSVLKADVVISLAKLKVHRKVGATLNLKNLVGINGDKNYLPHFQVGSPGGGGDEFPQSIGAAARGVYALRRRMVDHFLTRGNPILERAYVLSRRAYQALKRPMGMPRDVIQAGDWFGNDTCWRMVLDLNKILHYAAPDGTMQDRPQRRFFSIIDGIVAGEGEGPLAPDPRPCGLVIAGASPLATDLVGLRMIGFDWRKLPLYRRAAGLSRRKLMGIPPDRIQFASNDPALVERARRGEDRLFDLRAPGGWVGHCELSEAAERDTA